MSRADDLTFTAHDLSIPSSAGAIDVSWASIRLLSDPAFEAHWAAMAEEERRIIGELARRADLSEERLAEIEEGRARVSFATLERVLAPLGRGLDDPAGERDGSARERPVAVGAAGSALS